MCDMYIYTLCVYGMYLYGCGLLNKLRYQISLPSDATDCIRSGDIYILILAYPSVEGYSYSIHTAFLGNALTAAGSC